MRTHIERKIEEVSRCTQDESVQTAVDGLLGLYEAFPAGALNALDNLSKVEDTRGTWSWSCDNAEKFDSSFRIELSYNCSTSTARHEFVHGMLGSFGYGSMTQASQRSNRNNYSSDKYPRFSFGKRDHNPWVYMNVDKFGIFDKDGERVDYDDGWDALNEDDYIRYWNDEEDIRYGMVVDTQPKEWKNCSIKVYPMGPDRVGSYSVTVSPEKVERIPVADVVPGWAEIQSGEDPHYDDSLEQLCAVANIVWYDIVRDVRKRDERRENAKARNPGWKGYYVTNAEEFLVKFTDVMTKEWDITPEGEADKPEKIQDMQDNNPELTEAWETVFDYRIPDTAVRTAQSMATAAGDSE